MVCFTSTSWRQNEAIKKAEPPRRLAARKSVQIAVLRGARMSSSAANRDPVKAPKFQRFTAQRTFVQCNNCTKEGGSPDCRQWATDANFA